MSDGTIVLLVVAGLAVLAMFVGAVILLVKMVKARKLLTDAGVPVENKFLFWGAVAYLVSPVDLLPDPILLDDIGVMMIALRSLYAAADKAGITRRHDALPAWEEDTRGREVRGVR
ncbi:YkvA family protein [Streptomyces sp. CA-294286]|uniref:YkvA family protein n=1 Tax=Streptomyces sp. CA-294286 TaxID=3240070 RepID=UPI003D92A6FC